MIEKFNNSKLHNIGNSRSRKCEIQLQTEELMMTLVQERFQESTGSERQAVKSCMKDHTCLLDHHQRSH